MLFISMKGQHLFIRDTTAKVTDKGSLQLQLSPNSSLFRTTEGWRTAPCHDSKLLVVHSNSVSACSHATHAFTPAVTAWVAQFLQSVVQIEVQHHIQTTAYVDPRSTLSRWRLIILSPTTCGAQRRPVTLGSVMPSGWSHHVTPWASQSRSCCANAAQTRSWPHGMRCVAALFLHRLSQSW